jgi:tRNA(adenine34) deaminase
MLHWNLADCAGALYWSQISKIVFGASDESRGFLNGCNSIKTVVKRGV